MTSAVTADTTEPLKDDEKIRRDAQVKDDEKRTEGGTSEFGDSTVAGLNSSDRYSMLMYRRAESRTDALANSIAQQKTDQALNSIRESIVSNSEVQTLGLASAAEAEAATVKTTGTQSVSSATVASVAMSLVSNKIAHDTTLAATLNSSDLARVRDAAVHDAWVSASGIDMKIETERIAAKRRAEETEKQDACDKAA